MQATAAPTQASVDKTTAELAALARHLMGSIGAGFMREIERIGISMPQAKTLYLLDDEDGLTIKAMSDRLGLSEPAVSRGVESLVKRGLARRTDDPTDRRCKRVSLTAKGEKVVAGLSEVRIASFRTFVEGLDENEISALGAGLAPLMQREEIAHFLPEDLR